MLALFILDGSGRFDQNHCRRGKIMRRHITDFGRRILRWQSASRRNLGWPARWRRKRRHQAIRRQLQTTRPNDRPPMARLESTQLQLLIHRYKRTDWIEG